eukprot:SAG11_NODE_99_length_16913_cov_41.552813_13_plen_124_part_00
MLSRTTRVEQSGAIPLQLRLYALKECRIMRRLCACFAHYVSPVDKPTNICISADEIIGSLRDFCMMFKISAEAEANEAAATAQKEQDRLDRIKRTEEKRKLRKETKARAKSDAALLRGSTAPL